MTLVAEDVRAYKGPLAGGMALTPGTDDEIERAIGAEEAHQARVCSVPAVADVTAPAIAAREVLKEALLRRVVVNLARRTLPLGMQMNDVGAARLSTNDPEVRRLEAPFRKLVVG